MKKHKVGFSLLGKVWIVTMGEDGKSITDIQTKFGVSYFTKFETVHHIFLEKALSVIAECETKDELLTKLLG